MTKPEWSLSPSQLYTRMMETTSDLIEPGYLILDNPDNPDEPIAIDWNSTLGKAIRTALEKAKQIGS